MLEKSIAIDGFSASGKSTVSKIIAKKLGYIYLDTGAMYRAVTAFCLINKINYNDENEFQKNKELIKISFKKNGDVFCNGDNFTDIIRSKKVNENVPKVSSLGYIRKFLVKQQKEIAEKNNVVMDGRDIGTNVIPQAKNKFFLNCSLEVRAKRRYNEDLQRNIFYNNLKEVEKSLKERDFIDTTRKINPLKKAPDAIEIDTTNLKIDDVAELILKKINSNK